MSRAARRWLGVGAILVVAALASPRSLAQQRAPTMGAAPQIGVNLSGAELNPGKDRRNFDYVLPTEKQIDHFVARGIRMFRIPVLAERLLGRGPEGEKTEDWLALRTLIEHARDAGASVIVDFHQYGRTRAGLIGRDGAATREFAAAWGETARRLRRHRNVIFGLMNEPHEQSAAEWLKGANAAIAAIRAAGAHQLILAPGSYWTGAHSWTTTDNGEVMKGIVDPERNFAYEVHQYLDADSSGTKPEVVAGAGASRLSAFTAWARANRARAFLGEFGFAATPQALAEGAALLRFMEQNRDIWIGGAYWAAGQWWGDYMFSIEPKNDRDRPQLDVLLAK
ncbi:glycoside hydrolase family 5 protein [Methylosinus sp. Sm6]|uniref:glycoside hydrolase family 5 protein n=1 Tax=Methylosinus sp. Sm6 TaxID=2866948 RepID=UPI00351D1A96